MERRADLSYVVARTIVLTAHATLAEVSDPNRRASTSGSGYGCGNSRSLLKRGDQPL